MNSSLIAPKRKDVFLLTARTARCLSVRIPGPFSILASGFENSIAEEAALCQGAIFCAAPDRDML